MKVALLGPYPVQTDPQAGGPPLPGGVDAVVLALARGLARCPDVELHVVTAVPGLRSAYHYDEDGWTVHAIPRPRGGRLTGQKSVVANLCAEIAALQPDISHAHISGVHARAALSSPFPSVITMHGVIRREMEQAWPTSPWSTRLRWLADARFEDRVLADATEIISISPYILAECRTHTSARFHTVENPVDDRFFCNAPLLNRERLLCIGRVIPRKGMTTLLRAFGQIAQARPNARLTVVGEMSSEPAYAAQCLSLAQSLGVMDRVAFLGAMTPEALRKQYLDCDLFVLASEQETAPVSIAEAMAAGRPVLTTDVGGCGGMVTDGVCGRVVAPRDPAAFATAAIELLAAPARLAEMGSAAHRAAEARFRLASVIDQTLQVYQSVITAAKERRP